MYSVFKNGPTSASFSFIFGLSKQTIQYLQQINVKKCPFSLWHWDSNPQPLKHESSPTTTRPGLLQLLRNAEICLVRIGRQFGRPRLQNS